MNNPSLRPFLRIPRALMAVSFACVSMTAFGSSSSVAVKSVRSFGSLDKNASVELSGAYLKAGEPGEVLSLITNDKPIISHLEGASLKIAFKSPMRLRALAIPRIGWDDWAVPSRVSITIDGQAIGEFVLSAPRILPKAGIDAVDVIDLGETFNARILEVKILDTSIVKSQNKHGTFRLFTP